MTDVFGFFVLFLFLFIVSVVINYHLSEMSLKYILTRILHILLILKTFYFDSNGLNPMFCSFTTECSLEPKNKHYFIKMYECMKVKKEPLDSFPDVCFYEPE